MLAQDEIMQLRTVIREEIEAEVKLIRTDNARDWLNIQARLGRIEDKLKEVEVSNTRLEQGQETLQASQTRIEKMLTTEVTDIATNLRELMVRVPNSLKNHEERIEVIEDAIDLPRHS